MHFKLVPLVVALTMAAAAARADNSGDAKKLGDLFCLVGMNARDGGEFARIYLVTRPLAVAIDAAQKRSDAIAAAAPGDKPPLGDGVPFQSYADSAPVCHAGTFAEADGKQTVAVEFIFPDTPDGNWTDRLVVVPEDGRLRIDDVLYDDKGSGGSLREALVAVFDN